MDDPNENEKRLANILAMIAIVAIIIVGISKCVGG